MIGQFRRSATLSGINVMLCPPVIQHNHQYQFV